MLDAGALAVKALIVSWLSIHPHYLPHHQDAIIRRIQVESGFRPNVIAKTGSACLMQWTASRREALYRFAGTRSCPSVEKQLEFMDLELRGERAYKAFWKTTARNAFAVLTSTYSRPPRRRK